MTTDHETRQIFDPAAAGSPLADPVHLRFLAADARRQLAFFEASLRAGGGIAILDFDGKPIADEPLELHTTTRLVHSYALGESFGHAGAMRLVDAGMETLWNGHRDREHGGYRWRIGGTPADGDLKLAYGHAFVLLAAASAMKVGHPDAARLLADVNSVIERHFWDDDHGLMRDEFRADWSPFSGYRGMNANMHAAEALLTAFEATGQTVFLDRAGRILRFFARRAAPANGWRIPEHYTQDWQVDRAYRGNPMFRPAGTTPGHSFELARLALQYWDLTGRDDESWPRTARALVARALADAWNEERGGFAYTLDFDGRGDVSARYWWPVTEAIGVLAQLQRAAPEVADDEWYRRIWRFAASHLVDQDRGGWYPELDTADEPVSRQFRGKPDIYHALQAALIPLVPALSRLSEGIRSQRENSAD